MTRVLILTGVVIFDVVGADEVVCDTVSAVNVALELVTITDVVFAVVIWEVTMVVGAGLELLILEDVSVSMVVDREVGADELDLTDDVVFEVSATTDVVAIEVVSTAGLVVTVVALELMTAVLEVGLTNVVILDVLVVFTLDLLVVLSFEDDVCTSVTVRALAWDWDVVDGPAVTTFELVALEVTTAVVAFELDVFSVVWTVATEA